MPSIHRGWHDLTALLRRGVMTRRQMMPAAALAGAAALWPSLLSGKPRADRAQWNTTSKIKHVVILCQENRSFDHYFGFFADELGRAPHTAEGFKPRDLAYRDSTGRAHHPMHLDHYCDADPDHGWDGSHAKWNGGAMDGWVAAEGDQTTAIQYYKAAQHIYHRKLAEAFSLADHNFCAQIGPTLPNRLYLWSGTSGWNYLTPPDTSSLPYNNPSLTAPPPLLAWPTMADVLDDAGLPWKCYSVADGSLPSAIGAFNPLIFFSSILENPLKLARATADVEEFFADLAAGTLPAVSWIVTEAAVCEHPPAPPDMGQLLVARVVESLMASSAWDSSVLFVTYDEGGGYFDHVPPTILEQVPAGLPQAGAAVGPAFRVPLFIVSPYARAGTVYKPACDHTSILQFVERTFSTKTSPVHLPTIAPARRGLYSLAHAFDFDQVPNRPGLPTTRQLFRYANQEILTLNADRTVADCATTLPSWLGPLLGV
jgi:phospholipase C